jgi:deoxyribonuclease V
LKVRRLYRGRLSPDQAVELQLRLRKRLDLSPYEGTPRLVAGADSVFDEKRGAALAAAVVLELPSLEIVERAAARTPLDFPYIPGLLAFREGPALLAAFRKLKSRPDAVFIDAHGFAHPRRFGEACFVGMALNLPTVGVGKSILVGKHGPVPTPFGSSAPLVHEGETVGVAFRAADGTRPVYVSAGHRVDLASALRLTRLVCDGRRLPKPIREADRASKRLG